MDQQSVLITGGSGLIGSKLTTVLISRGYKVKHLSRSDKSMAGAEVYQWDPERRKIDQAALQAINFVVHLAGANVGEMRWTSSRKKEIVSSRIESGQFLFDAFRNNQTLKAFISASGAGYYGALTSDKIFTEEDPSGSDFLATTCRRWEETADLFQNSGIRTVKVRSAVVLDRHDSALSKILKAAKFGILPVFGDGSQYMPWIHIDDLCGIYLKAIDDSTMAGPYNAVSPEHTDNKTFMHTLRKVLKTYSLPLPVPSQLMRLILGEMSSVVLEGSRISSGKIRATGYEFLHPALEEALSSILCNS